MRIPKKSKKNIDLLKEEDKDLGNVEEEHKTFMDEANFLKKLLKRFQ